jgi:exodeoxyribonuclease-3
MRLYSWNVNGIRAVIKKGALPAFLDAHAPDVLCLQETKAQQGQAEFDLGDYKEFWSSAQKAGYSGTAIFSKIAPLSTKMGIPDEIVEKYGLHEDPHGDPTQEGRVLAAEFEQFWLVTVYTPNSKPDLSRLPLRHLKWDPAFTAYCKLLEQQKPVVFCGDLNVAHQEIDLANPKENVGKHGFTDEERQGFDHFLAQGFIDTFRHLHPDQVNAYTWWTNWANARARNVGWRIDYFLLSGSFADKLVSADIHPDVTGSDHCPVSIEIQV